MKKIEKEIKVLRQTAFFLVIMIILISGIIGIVIIEFNPFNSKVIATGNVIKENLNQEYYSENDIASRKNCFFSFGEKTLTIYSCNFKSDCENKIDDLINNTEISSIFDVSNISVIDCLEIKI